ncbi:MAG: hypothetical protein GY928_03960, partial [Colwellia sp.]|nr:hypothetical protein [Colwellia sp.]
QPSGGFFFDYDRLQYKRKKERKRLDDLEEEAERIKNKLDKKLALEFRKKEREESRVKELQVLTRLAKDHKAEVERVFNEKVIKAANRAIIQGNYSAMESLERQIKQVREEEEFLLEAARIYFNA